MDIVCLDLEGVLVPEIWIAFAEETGIPELKRTTRDEPDYNKLMNYRLNILREHGLGLKEIQETISKIDPLPGAREFLDKLNRLKIAKANRPLLANKTDEELMQVITSALEKRLPYYSKAKWRFNAEELESYAQIDRAVSRLNELIN